jgi:sugar lactone lactonase YvrE
MRIGRVPVPLAIVMDIYLDCTIEGSTTGPASAALRGTHDASGGIEWSGGWRRESLDRSETGFEPPVLEAEYLSDFSIVAAVRTELRVSFFGRDEAVLRIEPHLGASGDATGAPAWRWSTHNSMEQSCSFEPGILDAGHLPPYNAPPGVYGVQTGSGPYESDSHIFLREWSEAWPGGTPLDRPSGIAIGPGGNVYVTDQGNHRVVAYGPLGEYLLEWGAYGAGEGQFAFPSGIDVAADGTILVSDSGNHRVQRFTPGGIFLGLWGGEGTGDGEFVQPEGLAAGPDSLMAVCDSGTSTFSIFSVEGRFIGRFPSVLARGISFDDASIIYSSGCGAGGITKTERDGQPLGVIGSDLCVTDLAIGPDGLIYVLDYGNDRVAILDSSGAPVSSFGSSGSDPGQFDRPGGLAVSPEGFVYVADTANGRVQLFAPK